LLAFRRPQHSRGMPDHHTLLELVKISEALRDALREAYELARTGESGEPLREALHFARDLLDLANETLAAIRRPANTPAAWRCTWRNKLRPSSPCSGRSHDRHAAARQSGPAARS
jgi:hypothetical protein